MKPDEIDRLFRDELEKLDSVPDIHWNDEAAWDKITIQLKGGWNHIWTWGISVVAVAVSIYLINSTLPKEKKITAVQKPTREETVSLKSDSVKQPMLKEEAVIRKRQRKDNKPVPVEIRSDSTTLIRLDTIVKNIEDTNVASRQFKNRYRMLHASLQSPEHRFTMPQHAVFRMSIHNGFNFSNLLRSIDAEKNAGGHFYYIYEYNRSASPFRANTYPVPMYQDRQILTNFNKP